MAQTTSEQPATSASITSLKSLSDLNLDHKPALRFAADLITGHSPWWCCLGYVVSAHLGLYAVNLAARDIQTAIGLTVIVLGIEGLVHAIVVTCPEFTTDVALKITQTAESLASTSSIASDKRVQDIARLKNRFSNWLARHSRTDRAEAVVTTHLEHVLRGFLMLTLSGFVNSESGLWWTTTIFLWIGLIVPIVRDRLPGLDRISANLAEYVSDVLSSADGWITSKTSGELAIKKTSSDVSCAKTSEVDGSRIYEIADFDAQAKIDSSQVIAEDAEMPAPGTPGWFSADKAIPQVHPDEAENSKSGSKLEINESRSRSWSLLNEDGSDKNKPCAKSGDNEENSLADGWSLLNKDGESMPSTPDLVVTEGTGRMRGWSVLHDDKKAPRKERGWSILHDDSPALGKSKKAVVDNSLFDDGDHDEWLKGGAGADNQNTTTAADEKTDSFSPSATLSSALRKRGWSLLGERRSSPQKVSDSQ